MMWDGVINTAANLGLNIETIIFFIYLFGGIIWFSKGFQMGIIINWFLAGIFFVMFYAAGMNYTYFIISFFILLIILSLSLYFNVRRSQIGGDVV